MRIKIVTEKVVVKGVRMIKILELDGLTKEELPPRYLTGEHVYLSEDRKYLFYFGKQIGVVDKNDWPSGYLGRNEIIKTRIFHACLKDVKRCGERLAGVNKVLREENKHWHGEETFNI